VAETMIIALPSIAAQSMSAIQTVGRKRYRFRNSDAFALKLMPWAWCVRSAPVTTFNAYRPAVDRAFGCAVNAWRRHYQPEHSGLHPRPIVNRPAAPIATVCLQRRPRYA